MQIIQKIYTRLPKHVDTENFDILYEKRTHSTTIYIFMRRRKIE